MELFDPGLEEWGGDHFEISMKVLPDPLEDMPVQFEHKKHAHDVHDTRAHARTHTHTHTHTAADCAQCVVSAGLPSSGAAALQLPDTAACLPVGRRLLARAMVQPAIWREPRDAVLFYVFGPGSLGAEGPE
eukprot:5546466-Amphidinium_carterae.1